MITIKIPIDDYNSRRSVVLAFADSGYNVHVEHEKFLLETHYSVVVELPDLVLKEVTKDA